MTDQTHAHDEQDARTNADDLTFNVTDLARARLRKRGIETDDRLMDECKVTRGMLRSKFHALVNTDQAIAGAKDAPNDRRPWPKNMNAVTYEAIVGKAPEVEEA